jgi:hypothetical protein
MKTKIYYFLITVILLCICIAQNLRAQNTNLNRTGENQFVVFADSRNKLHNENNIQAACNDTVYSISQNTLYFCYYGSCGIDLPSMEISGSYGAAATADSAILWLTTWDHDGPGPQSSLPDSLAPGHDVRNSTNRAPFFSPSFIPSYVNTMPQITPFALKYFIAPTWTDSGKSMCFTPVAFDSVSATNQPFELDGCFGIGTPIQKIYVRAIHADHYYTCESGVDMLHIITWGGLPGFNHYQGYGEGSMYTVNVNGTNYFSHWGDTVTANALTQNIIFISDSLSTPGIATGCTTYTDTLRPFPSLTVTGLAPGYLDNSPDVTISVSPKPTGAMRIDFFTSEVAAAGIYLLDESGNTVYSLYPLGDDFGPGSLSDIYTSLYIYDLPLDQGPYSVVASGDDGLGWQYATCYGLNNDGYFQVFDLSSGDSLSTKLYPLGDNQCGALGTTFTDTFPNFYLHQYNITQLTTSGNPASLSSVDSTGNAVFSPSVAGIGTDTIIFIYNDNHHGLCDIDTEIIVQISSSVGVQNPEVVSELTMNNPVSDQLFIRQGTVGLNQIELIDAFGRSVLKSTFTEGEAIDVSRLSQGIYFCRCFDRQHNLVGEKKLVKMKVQ